MSSLIAYLGTTGRAATTRYQFFDNTGALIASPISAGIFETPGSRGIYAVANPTFPANAVGVSWTDTGDSTIYSQELFDFRTPNVDTGSAGALITAGTGTGQLSVTSGVAASDVVQISGDSLAADRLESILDGTGGPVTITTIEVLTDFSTINFEIGGGGMLNSGTTTLSGAVSLGSNLGVGGTTSFTGAVTASNASNNILLGGTSNTAIGTATNVVLSAAHGSGPWGYLPGPGPNAITVTVTDGSSDLQSVFVGLYQANVLIANGVTDVNGNVTFSLAAGTYQVVLVKGGYQFTPVSRTVTGPQAGTLVNDLVMTAISPIVPPVNPDMCNIAGFLLDAEGNPAANVEISFTLNSPNGRRPVTSGGNVINLVSITAVTDNAGFVSQEVIRTDALDQGGMSYTIFCESANINVTRPVAQATLDLSDL